MPAMPAGGEVVRAEAVTVPTSATANAAPGLSMVSSVVAESCNRIAPAAGGGAAFVAGSTMGGAAGAGTGLGGGGSSSSSGTGATLHRMP